MPSGLRAFRRRVILGLCIAALCGGLGVASRAQQATTVVERGQSTLRIGVPRASGAAATTAAPYGASNSGNPATTLSAETGTRLVIRPTAPPATAAPSPPPQQQTAASPPTSSAVLPVAPALQLRAPEVRSPSAPAPAAAYTASATPLAAPPVTAPNMAPSVTPSLAPAVATQPAAPLVPAAPAVRPLARPGTAAAPPVVATDAEGRPTIGNDGTLNIVEAPGAPSAAAAPPAVPPSLRNIVPGAALYPKHEEESLASPPTVASPAPRGEQPSSTSQSLPVVQPFSTVRPDPSTKSPATVERSPPPQATDAPQPQPSIASSPSPTAPEVLPQAVDVPDDLVALDAVAADPTRTQPLALEPVDFNGVLLGETTLEEVLQSWGDPLARNGAAPNIRLTYQIDPFAGVEVTFSGGKAAAVVVDLGDMFPPADVAKELHLDLADAVAVVDAAGNELGLVFPERGVSMRYEDGAAEPRVAQIGLDRVTARPFVMRAERRRVDRPTAALVDLATALKLNPDDGRAHWLRGRILAACGRPREALAAVETALRLDPKAAEYILARAGLLADQGLFDAALKDNETVLAGTQKLLHYQARAWRQRGDLLADGPKADAEAALDAHSRAIRIAETLVDDPTAVVRRDAKQTLIEAHLAVADDIAWGDFQAKEAAAGRWLAKAENLAKQAILEDGVSPYLILEVYQRGLAACVGTPGCVDPLDWAERLERATTAALQDCDDPLKRRQIQFDSGLGLYDALQALHARGDVDNALRFGTVAVEMIQAGRVGRDETPIDNYRFGRLYFRIGSLHAVAKNDHGKAVEWFDRAAPLLERPLPDAAAADRGRQGETLVSMGISYWTVGKRERGLHLTDVGSRYMQRAVSEGLLNPAAMGVAYSNLAVMHDGLGDQATGRRFHEMANRAEAAPTLQSGGTLRR